LALIHARTKSLAQGEIARVSGAFQITAKPAPRRAFVLGRVSR